MLLPDHLLTLERGRWMEKDRPLVPRDQRFLHRKHRGPRARTVRVYELMGAAKLDVGPSLRTAQTSIGVEFLQLFLVDRKTTPLLAELSHNVIQVYEAVCMLHQPRSRSLKLRTRCFFVTICCHVGLIYSPWRPACVWPHR